MKSPEAESALIAKLLVSPETVAEVVGKITDADFADPALRRAWRSIVKATQEHRTWDVQTLRSEGIDLGDPTQFLSVAHNAAAVEYARIIKLESYRRKTISALSTATQTTEAAADETEIANGVMRAVKAVLSTYQHGEVITHIEAAKRYRPAAGGLLYGIVPLDAAIQPARSGNMVVLAARPSVGKSWFAQRIASAWARGADHPVLFVSLEMDVDQLIARSISQGWADSDVNIHYYDEGRATTALIRAEAARLDVQFGGVAGIVIDYLQLLKDPGEDGNYRVAKMSGECKAIAREFKCPVLVLSQLNRAGAGRKPQLQDLRDSGAIEQDADVVLGLWRERLDSDDVTLSVLKNRMGPAGMHIELSMAA